MRKKNQDIACVHVYIISFNLFIEEYLKWIFSLINSDVEFWVHILIMRKAVYSTWHDLSHVPDGNHVPAEDSGQFHDLR